MYMYAQNSLPEAQDAQIPIPGLSTLLILTTLVPLVYACI